MRDITLDDTFYFHFTTRQFSDGVPTTLSGTPAISVVEDNNDTFITAGLTLDVDIGTSPVTGLHSVAVVATAANGYESGKSYSAFISTGTVGGTSVVGEIVERFTIAASAAAVDLANGTDGLGAIKTDTAAILVDTGTTLDNHLTDIKGTGFVKDTHSLIDIETFVDILDDGTSGNVKIATDVAAVLVDTAVIGVAGAGLTDLGGMSTGMKAEVEAEANDALVAQKLDHLVAVADTDDPVDNSIIAKLANSGATADWSLYVNTTDSLMAIRDHATTIKSETALIVADTNELQTDWVDGGRLDLILDARMAEASINTTGGAVDTVTTVTTTTTNTDMRGTDSAALASVCTEARLAELDAANLPTTTDNILTDTGTTLDTKLNDIQGATFSSATDSLEAIRDRGDAAWISASATTKLLQSTTIATLATQVSFTLTAGSADDDAYNRCTAIVTDVATATQKAVGLISDYTGLTRTVTLAADPGIFVMAATDTIEIFAPETNALQATTIGQELVDVTATGAVGIDWANVENPTTALDLSGTDIQLVDTTTTNTDMRGTDSAALASVCTEARLAELDAANLPADIDAILLDTGTTLDGKINTIDTVVDTILVDTADMQPKLGTPAGTDISADIAALKAETALIVADTNELQTDNVPGLIAALNDITADNVWDEAMVETTGAPAITGSMREFMQFWAALSRNRVTQTATTTTLRNDADAADLSTSTVSDDGTTFDRGEFTV